MLRLDTWIRELAALVLLAGIAELLLPSGRMKGYARALLGLLVLLGILQPLVGMLRGQISLQLPQIGAMASAGTAGEQAAATAAGQAFDHLVTDQVVRLAEGVPGVASAQATVSFAPDLRTPEAAQVQITPLGEGGGTAQAARVRRVVAAGLGLPVAAVTVEDW